MEECFLVNIYDLSSKLLATIKYPYGRKEEGQESEKSLEDKAVALETLVSRLMGEAMDRGADGLVAAWIAFMVPDLEK